MLSISHVCKIISFNYISACSNMLSSIILLLWHQPLVPLSSSELFTVLYIAIIFQFSGIPELLSCTIFFLLHQRFLNICQSTGRAILYSNWRVMSDTGFHTGQCSLFLTDYSTGAGQKPKCWVHGKLHHPLDDWWEAERFFFPFLFYLCKVETDSWPSKTQLKHS